MLLTFLVLKKESYQATCLKFAEMLWKLAEHEDREPDKSDSPFLMLNNIKKSKFKKKKSQMQSSEKI